MGYALCRRPLTIAHCTKIADSWYICKSISDFWCPNLWFGILGASTLASWGTLGRSWDTWGAQEKTLWGPGLDFHRFPIKDFFLTVFWMPWIRKGVFCHACFQVSFSGDFGVWIWMSGSRNPSIWYWMYCKNQVSQKDGFLMMSGSIFHDFGWPWD